MYPLRHYRSLDTISVLELTAGLTARSRMKYDAGWYCFRDGNQLCEGKRVTVSYSEISERFSGIQSAREWRVINTEIENAAYTVGGARGFPDIPQQFVATFNQCNSTVNYDVKKWRYCSCIIYVVYVNTGEATTSKFHKKIPQIYVHTIVHHRLESSRFVSTSLDSLYSVPQLRQAFTV